MSMKLTNDIQQLQVRVETIEHHVANVRQVTDNLVEVARRLEAEMAENKGLLEELKNLKGMIIQKTAGLKDVRGKKAIG